MKLPWLGTILGGRHDDEVEVPADIEPPPAETGPPFMVLVSTGGIVSFRLHTFSEVQEAADFIQPWFPPGMSHGIVTFWALHEQPLGDPELSSAGTAEPVVLIRDPARAGMVDLISCVDMASAQNLVRDEAERGLDLRLFMVYWAAPVSIQVDDDGIVRLTPQSPPQTRRTLPAAEPASQIPSAEVQVEEGDAQAAIDVAAAPEIPSPAPAPDVQRTQAPSPPSGAHVSEEASTTAEAVEVEPESMPPLSTETVETGHKAGGQIPAESGTPIEPPPPAATSAKREGGLASAVIIDQEPEIRGDLRKALTASGFLVTGEAGFGSEAIELVKGMRPEVVMVAVAEPIPRAIQMMEAIASAVPRSAVVAYSSLSDNRSIRAAMLAGAADYLVTPIPQDELLSSLQSVLAHKERRRQRLLGEAAERPTTGRVVTVFGAKGGIGKTTIATNLAVVVAQKTHQSVVLVDLDPRFGDVGVALDISPDWSIADLVLPEEEIDRELVESCLCTHESGVKVLAAPMHPTLWRTVQPSHVERVLSLLAQTYDCIILDTPGTFNDVVDVALKRATDVLLVTTPQPTSVKDSLLAIKMMQSGGSNPGKLNLVLNMTSDAIETTPEEIGRALGWKVAWTIPYDPDAAFAAAQGFLVDMTQGGAMGVLSEMARVLSGEMSCEPASADQT
jgi:pilus assembly protein CpaE